MKVDNWRIYDLALSIAAAGLPMQSAYSPDAFGKEADAVIDADGVAGILAIQRAERLADNQPGTGHCNFLSGILVAANVTATNVWWLQLERYHFVQIVSMQSKMHRLRAMVQNGGYHGLVMQSARNLLESMEKMPGITDEALVYNCPMGLELTARISTNFLQLKTIYQQRKNHKLQEWKDFCAWIKTLPYQHLITGEQRNDLQVPPVPGV